MNAHSATREKVILELAAAIAKSIASVSHNLFPDATTAILSHTAMAASYRAAGAPGLAGIYQAAAEHLSSTYNEPMGITVDALGFSVPDETHAIPAPVAPSPPPAPVAPTPPPPKHDDGLPF